MLMVMHKIPTTTNAFYQEVRGQAQDLNDLSQTFAPAVVDVWYQEHRDLMVADGVSETQADRVASEVATAMASARAVSRTLADTLTSIAAAVRRVDVVTVQARQDRRTATFNVEG